MKILQVVNYFSPAYAFGGPAKTAFQVSRKLVKGGHEVVVWTSDAKDRDSRLAVEPVKVVDGINVHYMRNLSMMTIKKSNLFITPELISKVKEEIKEFDIIHLHGYRTFQNIVVQHYSKKYGVPYVLQARGSLPRIMAKQRLKWIYDVFFGYRLLRDASKVIALCRIEADQYMDMGVQDEKIKIIPNGIELSEYADLPPKGSFKEKFNIPKDTKIVLYLGRIHTIKGIDFLVKAYAHLIKKFKNILLVVVGPDDGYLDKLRWLISSLNIADDVLLTGSLYGKDKLEAYVDADIFVLPSRYEIFGNVVLESYACSKPVVGTRVGGLQDIVFDGKTGLLVKPGDVKELYSAIFTLLNDDESRISMGMQARKVVEEKFSIEKIVDKIEETYGEVIGR